MSTLLDSSKFGTRLYDTLPHIYHTEDSMVDYALKRYLQALSDGGYSYVIKELNGILDLNDPSKTPADILSIIFEQYGLKIFNGIPETYLRKLLPILRDLYARKGATTVIEYLTAIISDVKAEVTVSPDFKNDFHIDLRLEMDYDQQGARDIPDREQLLRIIKEFLPFFIEVTIIFVYLFYEFAKINAKEYHHNYVTEVRSEHTRLPHKKGSGDFPTLNNFSLGLNRDFILNETYYYSTEVDQFWDKITNILSETGNMDREKSHQYLRPTLNNPFKVLNKDFLINDYIDTDELVKTNIKTRTVSDLGRLRFLESFSDSLSVIFQEDSILNYLRDGEDFTHLKVYEYEEAYIRSDKSTEFYKSSLNDYVTKLNLNFILNEGIYTDFCTDSIDIPDDSSKVIGTEELVGISSIGRPTFYATLNTGLVLNRNLETNNNHFEKGSLSSNEGSFSDKIESLFMDTSLIPKGTDNKSPTILNGDLCVLNSMLLNNISDYVKITMNGESTLKVVTSTGIY